MGFAGLESALYGAGMSAKAAVWAPLSKFVPSGSGCTYVENAKAYIEGQAREINGALPDGSTSDQIRHFAEKGFNSPFSDNNLSESYLHLKYFITKTCGESLPDSATLNQAAQKGVDLFYDMTKEVGHAVPFTNSPMLDAIIMGSVAVGTMVGGAYVMGKKGIKLFYKY